MDHCACFSKNDVEHAIFNLSSCRKPEIQNDCIISP